MQIQTGKGSFSWRYIEDTHRFLWKNMDPVKKPDHYVMQAVTFGARPSGAIAVTALRKTAVLFRECHRGS